jgi:hypothetical protein
MTAVAESPRLSSPADLAIEEQLRRIEDKQDRILACLDVLASAIADAIDDEEGEPPALTLDGEYAGAPRDPSKGLS